MTLSKEIKRKIKEHSLRESPREACGLITRKQGVLSAHEALNNSEDIHRFRINAFDYVRASGEGQIVAVYHSHQKGYNFSELDKLNSQTHELIYILYCLENNSFLTYDPKNEFNNYIGKDFKWGTSDCFTLVRDFYKEELNIDIGDYPREDGWEKKFGPLFDKYFEKENFKEIKNLKKYDGILFRTRKDGPSVHCAVYLGEGLMLHQPRNTISRIDEYDERFKKITSKIVRHVSL
jgi:proteasome lid subunit RPN8/RPN11